MVTSDLSTMRETPGLGPRNVILVLLWYQAMWEGGEEVQDITQVRFIRLEDSTNI